MKSQGTMEHGAGWGLGLSAYAGPSFPLLAPDPKTGSQPPAYCPCGHAPPLEEAGRRHGEEGGDWSQIGGGANSPPESCAPMKGCTYLCVFLWWRQCNFKWQTKKPRQDERERDMAEKREESFFSPPDV